ncbi:betaine/proline/choline family ABC transporter ATP-binding protein [Aurantimonas aggregata]|uniref:Quaternary amine transport ATP-binding protein n=2 Tax=Aurantimonas aggregata TaxID=2047720 RepID=A0A6L9MJF3_9HYPH|nr:betaine/proline/choline family ABC transporter ATP-binding protein [Aurantimonas aggregata]
MLENGSAKEAILRETGSVVGVHDVNFDIEAGQIFVVMGLSGSGKSTLIRMLNGLIQPTAGEVLIDGENVANRSDAEIIQIRRGKIAMVFQHFALFPHKTVMDNVAYGLKVKGTDAATRDARAIEALERVGLSAYARSYPEQLSGGMQQRVGLARALAADVDILLMDEPFGALDPLIRRDMQEELLRLQQSLNKTIVFITHDLNEALMLGDRIAIMKGGRFVQVGTAEEIVGAPADEYVAAFTQDIDRSRVFSTMRVTEPAHALDSANATRETALAAMRSLGRDALYLVEAGLPLGVLTHRSLTDATAVGQSLEAVARRDFPRTSGNAPIYTLYPLASHGVPIAVVDDDDRLIGIVEPGAICREVGLGNERDRTGSGADLPPGPGPGPNRQPLAASMQEGAS